jgi:hypothetical protein
MPNANYYREQARLLLRWAIAASQPEVAERLSKRAQDMLALADRADTNIDAHAKALDIFDAPQKSTSRERAKQR